MKSLLFSLLLLLASVALPLATTSPVQAAVSTRKPTAALSYSGGYFRVTVNYVTSVNYTIEYTRNQNGKESIEGIQGGGKAKKGTFTARNFAGTQSTKYFIKHLVKKGKLIVTGKDLAGKNFQKTINFTVGKNGTLIFK